MQTESTQKIMTPLIFYLFSLLQLSDHFLISTLNWASRKNVLAMRRRAIQLEREDIWTGLKPDKMRSLPPNFELVVVNASDFSLESFSPEQLSDCFYFFRYGVYYA